MAEWLALLMSFSAFGASPPSGAYSGYTGGFLYFFFRDECRLKILAHSGAQVEFFISAEGPDNQWARDIQSGPLSVADPRKPIEFLSQAKSELAFAPIHYSLKLEFAEGEQTLTALLLEADSADATAPDGRRKFGSLKCSGLSQL